MLFQNPILVKPYRLKDTTDEALQKSLNDYKYVPGISSIVTLAGYICTLISFFYFVSSPILFYYVEKNIFRAIIHLPALLSIVTNSLVLIQTKKITRATNIILTSGTSVVLYSFTTGRWINRSYLRQLINNCQTISSYE